MRAILAVWAYSDAYPLRLGVLSIGGFAISVGERHDLQNRCLSSPGFICKSQLQARAGSIPTM